MLNVQLDRLDGMIQAMRAEKTAILRGDAGPGRNLASKATPMNSPEVRLFRPGHVQRLLLG